MSIEAIGYAFTLILPAFEKWLLITLANHAPVSGELIFPSLETLEANTGMSRSTIKRAFKGLIERGIVERVAESTGVSPAFYRIIGVPEPKELKSDPSCPPVLRKAVIVSFAMTCEYCKRSTDSKDYDPDGKPWTIDRVVPGKRNGIYSPDNVTLACRACNNKKRANPAPADTRTLTDLQQERRVLSEPSSPQPMGAPPELGDPSLVDAPRVPADPREGAGVNPEPCIESSSDPVLIRKAGAAPRQPAAKAENPDDNVGVITVIAHEAIDQLGLDHTDLAETVKSLCATRDILYNSVVVTKAIDSATWQRRHRKAAG